MHQAFPLVAEEERDGLGDDLHGKLWPLGVDRLVTPIQEIGEMPNVAVLWWDKDTVARRNSN